MYRVWTNKKQYYSAFLAIVLMTLFGAPSIVFAEENPANVPVEIIPTDEFELNEVGAQLAQASALINASQFRQECSVDGSGYAAAVIDTGVDYNHPNLGGGWGNRVVAGYDFVNNDADPMDDNGHGTHVAGIIASDDATHRGIAPGADIIALKVLGANGSGNFSAVESALQWVIANRATYNIVTINLSLGTGNFTSNPYSFLEDELNTLLAANVQVFAAAGNSFYNLGSAPGIGYPAISPQIISIGAAYDANVGQISYGSGAIDYTTAADRVCSFSQRHANLLDFMAPGAMITSTQRGGGFVGLAGTSMASPIAAGAAVLLRAGLDSLSRPDIHQSDIVGFLAATASTINDGDDENDNVTNTGANYLRINMGGLCALIMGQAPSPSPSPSASPSASASASPAPSSAPPAASPSASPSPSTSPTPAEPTVPELVQRIGENIAIAFRARTPEQQQDAIARIDDLIDQLIRLLRSYGAEVRALRSTSDAKVKTTQKLIKALQRYKTLVLKPRSPEIRGKLRIARKRVKKFSRTLERLDS